MTGADAKAFVKDTERPKFSGIAYKKISAVSVKNDRVYIDINDPLFKQGYEAIDMSKIGIPAAFPKEWLSYKEDMPLQKLFIGHEADHE